MRALSWGGLLLSSTAVAAPAGDYIVTHHESRPQLIQWAPEQCGEPPEVPQGTLGQRYRLTSEGSLLPARERSPVLFGPGACAAVTGVRAAHAAREHGVDEALALKRGRLRCTTDEGASRSVLGELRRRGAADGNLEIAHSLRFLWEAEGASCEVQLDQSWTLKLQAKPAPPQRERRPTPEPTQPPSGVPLPAALALLGLACVGVGVYLK